MGLVSLS